MAAPRTLTRARPLVFAYLGGRAAHKGYYWLQQILADVPESNYVLRVVDIESRMGVHHLHADQWPIKGRLEIVPPYDQSDLDSFFEDVDVLLFPSQWKESFGLTVREALVRHVWVIATDCGGPSEEIIPGENGELIVMEDAVAYRDALRALLQAPERLANYRNPYAHQIRGYAAQARELLDIIHDVLGNKRTPTVSATPSG